VLGLFLKLVLADRFAILANLVYDNPGHYPTFTVWTGVFCFFGQVYMDFAGYASIAIGSARLFGVRLTENFNNPLAARSVADFWNRWHITLTSWFRDYLFTPLGGFRKGGVRAAINGCLVLLICGLWHGASWHFVAWGAYHAVFLTLYYVWRYWAKSAGLERNRSTEGFSVLLLAYVLITLIIGTVGTVLFRATDLSVAGQVFRAMLGVHAGAGKPVEWYTWIYATLFWGLIAVEFSQAYLGGRKRVQESPAWMRAIGYSVLAIAALLCAVNLQTPYIYFQF
jgi:alginate O-acetyltransferase complex protein AlgI